MEKEIALELFGDFEKVRHPHDEEPLAPVYDVRLDAGHYSSEDTRDFRLRLTPGPWGWDTEHIREVVLMAAEHDLVVSIQNNGIEIR